jgi:hypothetical protein
MLHISLNTKRVPTKTFLIWFFTAIVSTAFLTQTNLSSDAETGKGADVFKVILTVFGVENTKGDVVAIVTANNGEASKVKFLETEGFKPVSSSNLTTLAATPSPGSTSGILEYIATFPNVTVNSGAEYKVCVMTTKAIV